MARKQEGAVKNEIFKCTFFCTMQLVMNYNKNEDVLLLQFALDALHCHWSSLTDALFQSKAREIELVSE